MLLECCSKPEMKLLCFGAASVSGHCGDGGKQIREEKNQEWEAQEVNVLVQEAYPGRGSGRKGFADAAFLCSYLPLWQQPQPARLFGNRPKALMKAGGEEQRSWLSGGPLSLKAIGFL